MVHDLLGVLAERMTALNKDKQTEAKGFLTWLERHVGASVDDLNNKTLIRGYHEHNLDDMLTVVRQNRKRLTANPDSRTFQEILDKEFTASTTRLAPLKTHLAASDRLIDQIVYRLYGLTPAEVALIEGETPPTASE